MSTFFITATKTNTTSTPTNSRVVVSTNRQHYGNNSTLSKFTATAYDKKGNNISSMNGYFLEPQVDHKEARTEGSNKAIPGGRYQVIPKAHQWQKYQWYLKNVEGRTGIAIHTGNYGKDTEGCLLPGAKYSYDKEKNEYNVWESTKKTKELFNFFKKHGKEGIEIIITPL